MNVDFFVLNVSGKVEYKYSMDVVGDFVPRVGDFTCVPGSAKVFVVSRVLISWIPNNDVSRFVPRVRVDLGFVDRGVFDDY